MADLTDEQLAEWEALQAAATPGPWHAKDELIWAAAGGEAVATVADWGHPAVQRGDAEFIAAARTAVPLLLRALRDARADVERISGAWCEVIQREQRSDNAHWYDMTQLEAERDLLRAEAELHRVRGDRLQCAIEQALEDMGTSTLGAHILRTGLAAPTGQEGCDCGKSECCEKCRPTREQLDAAPVGRVWKRPTGQGANRG